jgi:hypothetical protein
MEIRSKPRSQPFSLRANPGNRYFARCKSAPFASTAPRIPAMVNKMLEKFQLPTYSCWMAKFSPRVRRPQIALLGLQGPVVPLRHQNSTTVPSPYPPAHSIFNRREFPCRLSPSRRIGAEFPIYSDVIVASKARTRRSGYK